MKHEWRIITADTSTSSSIINISHYANELLVVECAMIFWMQLQFWSLMSYTSFARNAGITVWTHLNNGIFMFIQDVCNIFKILLCFIFNVVSVYALCYSSQMIKCVLCVMSGFLDCDNEICTSLEFYTA
jgi:hypothetical protein